MVKRSEVRSQIDSIIKNDPMVQQAIQEEAHRANLHEAKKQAQDIDALILMALHHTFGFAKVRLLRFAKGLAEVQKYFEDRYDDSDMFAMKKYLKDKLDIDITKFQEEVDRLAAEEDTDSR